MEWKVRTASLNTTALSPEMWRHSAWSVPTGPTQHKVSFLTTSGDAEERKVK